MYRWADLEEVALNPLIKGRVVEVLEDAEYLDVFAPARQDFS